MAKGLFHLKTRAEVLRSEGYRGSNLAVSGCDLSANAGGEKAWEVRKPGPVRFRAAIIYLAPQLLVASSDQPERARLRAATYAPASRHMSFCLFLLQVGFT